MWFDYTGGADTHHHYDMDDGFFFEAGENVMLSPGQHCSWNLKVTVPRDGTYTAQFERHYLLGVRINEADFQHYDCMMRHGLLPAVDIRLHKGMNCLNITLTHPDDADQQTPLTAKFHLRLIDENGDIVRQERLCPDPGKPPCEQPPQRPLPDLADYTPAVGASCQSVGRFGYTKGDGLLDCAMSEFGLITKAYVWGDPRYTKHLLWHYSIVPQEAATHSTVEFNYEPSEHETIKADWTGVRWSKTVGPRTYTLDYSILTPSILLETNDSTLHLRQLKSACACRRILLPLARGIVERPDTDGCFYQRKQDGDLAENWILLFDHGAFPEIPILLILRTSPDSITVKRDAQGRAETMDLNFETPLQWAMTATPFGIESMTPTQLNQTWIQKAIHICRRQGRAALARPVACKDYFRIHRGQVEVTQLFDYRILKDDFGTQPLTCAPIPPNIALAAQHVQSIHMDSQAVSWDFPTKYGPLYAVMNSTWSDYSMPIPEYRRDFSPLARRTQALSEDFQEFLDYHRNLTFIPNPGVHQFLFPFVVPLLTANELTKAQRKDLMDILAQNLKRACSWDATYQGPQQKTCHMWYERKEPFSGVSYAINYLHVSGITELPDGRRKTVMARKRPFIEVDWGNGIALYSIYLAAMFTNEWQTVQQNLTVIHRAFDYFLKTMDWACLCAPYCENGRGWSDGTNYGGYLGYLNIMEILGEKQDFQRGLYAYAKMTANRMALFHASQHYFCRYFNVKPWYTSKTFCDEAGPCLAATSYPQDIIHGRLREQSLYNMTTEGHYPEAFDMYATACRKELKKLLDAVEQSQTPQGTLLNPLPEGTESVYHTHEERLGEQEIYTYLMLCLKSGRFDDKTLLQMVRKAARNQRLSREFLGAHVFSYRRVPKHWEQIYLEDQILDHHGPKLLRWFGLTIDAMAWPNLHVTCKGQKGWLELRCNGTLQASMEGHSLKPLKRGDIWKVNVSQSGIITFQTAEPDHKNADKHGQQNHPRRT